MLNNVPFVSHRLKTGIFPKKYNVPLKLESLLFITQLLFNIVFFKFIALSHFIHFPVAY